MQSEPNMDTRLVGEIGVVRAHLRSGVIDEGLNHGF